MPRQRGFTLTELLIALALTAILTAALARLLLGAYRVAQRQAQQAELDANLRSAIAMLPLELRELDASDPLGSDIIRMTDSSLGYKAMRSLYIACRPLAGTTLYLDTASWGLRSLDPDYDSLLILAGRGDAGQDRWMHVDLRALRPGRGCPGGRPSLAAIISPGIAAGESTLAGSPVRGFEVAELRRYRDAGGVTWLGARRYRKANGWSDLQPVTGPLRTGGLVFNYFAADGSLTRDPGRVARIGISVTGRSSLPVRLGNGTPGFLVDSLATQVALRNNR